MVFCMTVSFMQQISKSTNTYTGHKNHDDVIKWKYFPRYWPFVREIHRSPVNFPHKGQWRGALMFTLICARKNGWVNNGEAGDLRRYLAHYDVIVMTMIINDALYCWIPFPLKWYYNCIKWNQTLQLTSNGLLKFIVTCDVIKWKHFPRYWSFVKRIHRSTAICASNQPVTGAYPSRRTSSAERVPHHDVITISLSNLL